MANSSGPSPVMAQYFAAKETHPDALVFFRMGDFYELFFADAEDAAAVLDITLTRRGQHGGQDIPMAGVPVHAMEGYLARLIRAGRKVAICEQLESPEEAKKRGSKSIVRRGVVRLVTPGTLTEDALLEPRRANRLAAVAWAAGGSEAALAWADVSTGAFEVIARDPAALADEIAALSPGELIVPDTMLERLGSVSADVVTPLPAAKADPRAADRRLKDLFGVATLDAFGGFGRAELSACGLLVDYVMLTQAGAAPRLRPPRRAEPAAVMLIDPATRASLEIDRSARGGREGSLLAALDRTVTAGGARLLAERLARPSTRRDVIAARHDAVAMFLEAPGLRAEVRGVLGRTGDLARALGRLRLGRGGPRDLVMVLSAAEAGAALHAALAGLDAAGELAGARAALDPNAHPALADFAARLSAGLNRTPALMARDGGFILPGFDPALDETATLRDDSRRVIAGLQARYAEETGIPLKIKHIAIWGFVLEATPKQAEALMAPPWSATFHHRQTLSGMVRFTTTELVELDGRVARAGEAALSRELAIFEAWVREADALAEPLTALADALAVIDVAAGLADRAADGGWTRPELTDDATFALEAGRHPVVEAAVRKAGEPYTPNDATLDGDGVAGPRLLLVTGPNMAGKSTYLRQCALMAILAQAGAFVPAGRFSMGIADRVFSRVGASDDLSRGRSTFMTEMVETAAILHQAGPRALVILDEIGRGTATWDGLAIAWATAEHLHEVNRCRALFATHYHEMTALADRLDHCANVRLEAREWDGDLVFLHEVKPGAADRSYGVQVARLAGLPATAVARAKALLERLEAGDGEASAARPASLADLPLFAAPAPTMAAAAPHPLEVALAQVDPDDLTPREALDLVARLKAMADRRG